MNLPESDSEDELPPGWEERVTVDGSVFYANHLTKATQWTHPRTGKKKKVSGELPFGWERCVDKATGKVVYVDHENRRTTYTDPRLAFAIEEKEHVNDYRQRFDASSTALQDHMVEQEEPPSMSQDKIKPESSSSKMSPPSESPNSETSSMENSLRQSSPNVEAGVQPSNSVNPPREKLCDATVHRYLLFLTQGMPAEEARRKALTYKRVQKKREQSDVPVAESIQIAVLPVDYPQVYLTTKELKLLEGSIVKEISSILDQGLQFRGVSYKQSMLLVNCVNTGMADWLVQVVPRLQTWQGVPLTTCAAEDVPSIHIVKIVFPFSSGQRVTQLLDAVQSDNPSLHTDRWIIHEQKEHGQGQLWRISIDKDSYQTIKKRNHYITYGFTKVRVRGVDWVEIDPQLYVLPTFSKAELESVGEDQTTPPLLTNQDSRLDQSDLNASLDRMQLETSKEDSTCSIGDDVVGEAANDPEC